MAHILVIEDDVRIRDALTRTLGEQGHSVDTSATALAGLHQVLDLKPDLVLLDLGLPDLDGTELLRMLRAVSQVPVIVATARDENSVVVGALDAGADDYVVKPFDTGQLVARVNAVLRRSRPAADGAAQSMALGELFIDPRSRRVTLAGRSIELSPKEFDLLAFLAARGCGGVQARIARRGVAAAVRGRGQDRRRALVVVAIEVGRVGARAALSADGAGSRRAVGGSGRVRRRITALVAAVTSVVLLAFLIPAAYLVSRVAQSNVEARARSQLQALIPLVAAGDLDAARIAADRSTSQGLPAWITLADGSVFGTDPSKGALKTVGADTAVAQHIEEAPGRPGGTLFTQPVSRDGGTVVIRVLATEAKLSEGVPRIWAILGGLGLVLFLLALLVADRMARSISRPVTRLADAANRLESGDLDARVDPNGPPEVRDVGVALNRLAKRIVELVAAERESVADLSHRLRTPITALRLDADAVTDPQERARLVDDVDELNRTVDEVIRSARRPIADEMGAECDAAAVVRARLAFWSILAREQHRDVRAHVADVELRVSVGASELGAALDALLGNVFAHTPAGVAFAVSATPAAGDLVCVEVIDDGAGLPGAVATERGESGTGSTGLGLSIVHRTLSAAGGSVAYGTGDAGGAKISMLLPRLNP